MPDRPTFRPDLEPDGLWSTGPGPLSPLWAPPEPPAPRDPLEALHDALRAARQDCFEAIRRREEFGFVTIGRSDLAKLNAHLEAARALNATLAPRHRVGAVADWPTPPLPLTVLLGPRDLVPILDAAIRAVATVLAHRTLYGRRVSASLPLAGRD